MPKEIGRRHYSGKKERKKEKSRVFDLVFVFFKAQE